MTKSKFSIAEKKLKRNMLPKCHCVLGIDDGGCCNWSKIVLNLFSSVVNHESFSSPILFKLAAAQPQRVVQRAVMIFFLNFAKVSYF